MRDACRVACLLHAVSATDATLPRACTSNNRQQRRYSCFSSLLVLYP